MMTKIFLALTFIANSAQPISHTVPVAVTPEEVKWNRVNLPAELDGHF